MELEYIYFEADEGGYIGYFTDFPQHVTEGETIEELEEMLFDMSECLNLSKKHNKNAFCSRIDRQGIVNIT